MSELELAVPAVAAAERTTAELELAPTTERDPLAPAAEQERTKNLEVLQAARSESGRIQARVEPTRSHDERQEVLQTRRMRSARLVQDRVQSALVASCCR